MIVLGIETTCDETAIAIVEDGRTIHANVIASQEDIHSKYGGVFPELACRRHIDIILPLINQALKEAELSRYDIDLIAVARGPGLMGALLIGLITAKTLSEAWDIPYVGVNHVEAHLYAAMMDHNPQLPAVGVVLSGGHTALLEIEQLGKYRLLGQTVDDAIGEAFDKVASLLGLPYPGGPEVEILAKSGHPDAFPLKAGTVKGRPLDFSFSGLKTNVLYQLKGQSGKRTDPDQLNTKEKADLAASFQKAAFSDVVSKTLLAANGRPIYLGGGVTANKNLRQLFADAKQDVHWPAPGLSLDNAAMIAGLGIHVYKAHGPDSLQLEAMPRCSIY